MQSSVASTRLGQVAISSGAAILWLSLPLSCSGRPETIDQCLGDRGGAPGGFHAGESQVTALVGQLRGGHTPAIVIRVVSRVAHTTAWRDRVRAPTPAIVVRVVAQGVAWSGELHILVRVE